MDTKINKKTKCPICNSNNIEKYWAMPGYRLSKCQKCSMVWDHFPPDNITSQYEKNYFSNDNPKGGYANYFEGMEINKKTFNDRLNKIEKYFNRKVKLLDVGCALGDCLTVAKKLGWTEIYGLELSKYASDFAKKRGLKIFHGTLLKNKIDQKFDLITMQDVIEHVEDPIANLKAANKLLNKKGIIYLVTPDVGGLWQKILKRFWYHYKPGEHIMYFSQKSLSIALKNAGFKNIKTQKTYHVMSLEYILNRLKYYSPFFFGNLTLIIKKTPFRKIAFNVYAGEIEAWGEKL